MPDPIEAELVTPTGAAILVNVVDRFAPCPLTKVDRIGYGLGTRVLEGRANALRILAEEADDAAETEGPDLIRETIAVLTTHVDDMNPEWYGVLWQRLFDAGAVDVGLIPISMKKGRPGVRMEVMAPMGRENGLAKLILANTMALGVRVHHMERLILPRRQIVVETPWGPLKVKEANGIMRVEYDDLVRLARERDWTLPEAQQRVAPYLVDGPDGD